MEYSFGSCTSLKLLDFSSHESVPTLYAANAGMADLYLSKALELERMNNMYEFPFRQFAKEHVLKFTHLSSSFSRGNNGSDSIELVIQNIGEDTISNVEVLLGYKGKNGADCTRQEIEIGISIAGGEKASVLDVACPGEHYDGGEISRIVPKAYQYRKGYMQYMINIERETVEKKKLDIEFVNYKRNDILDFAIETDNSKGFQDYRVHIQNTGNIIVDSIKYNAGWYDAEGRLLSDNFCYEPKQDLFRKKSGTQRTR